MQEQTSDIIHREVFTEAPPATVFAFFTDPDKMARWMGVSHDIDPRPSGIYLVDVTRGNIARGEYREVNPNSRIVFTWGWQGEDSSVPPGSSEVAIDLAPQEAGTELTLTHSGLPTDQVEMHNKGWVHDTGCLVIAAAGGDAEPDPMVKSAA